MQAIRTILKLLAEVISSCPEPREGLHSFRWQVHQSFRPTVQERCGKKRLKRSGKAQRSLVPDSLLSRDVVVPVPSVAVGIGGCCVEQGHRVTSGCSRRLIGSLGVLG